MVFVICLIAAGAGILVTTTGGHHALFFRGNPAPGIARLGVLGAMAWIVFVLWRYADPSVTGFYVVFYVVMGYAVVKLLGQVTIGAYGARLRVDAVERRNVPAAVVVAAFTLATGMIFGGSLWGEADPTGDDEGGFWIPLGFFLMGWMALIIAFGIYLRREGGRFRHLLQRDRSMADARAAASFLVAAASLLTEAVAGDFWGWRHGILTFGVLAALLILRELFASWAARRDPNRIIESAGYLLLALGAWQLNRLFDAWWAAG